MTPPPPATPDERAVPFALRAPNRLGRLPRTAVRLVRTADGPAALVLYGKGPGGLAVLQRRKRPGERAAVVETALGTVVRATGGGVTRIVVASTGAARVRTAAAAL